tara:strand:- start:162 stop:2774 length:2613 start_codon:yes stop_codon:yes gene_type:complete
MARSKFLQSSFVSGELSPLLKGRIDLEQYYQGLATAENVLIVPQGGLKRRAGSEHVTTALKTLVHYTNASYAPTMPEGGTAANINDLDSSNTATTTTNIGLVGTATAGTEYVVAHYDLSATGISTNIQFVDIKGLYTTGTVACTLIIQTSTDNTTWTAQQSFTVSTDSDVPTSFRKRIEQTIATPYVRLVRSGDADDDLGAQKFTIDEFNVYTTTTAAVDVKTFDFSVETDRHYLCILTAGNMAVYRIPHAGSTETVYVADIPMLYSDASIAKVRDVQTENVMLMFHEDYPPIRIINDNLSNYNSFAIDDVPFLNVPQYDYNDLQSPSPISYVTTLLLTSFTSGDRFQIDVEGVLSKNITYTNSASSTAANIQRNLQEMPIFGDTGVVVTGGNTTFTVTVSGESTKSFELWSAFTTSEADATANVLTFTLVTQGSPRKEDVWSATRGYPKTAAFYNGRLWLGGTKSKLQSLFGSRSGSFFDFYTEEGDADEGIFITISSRQLTEIIDINPDRGLQVFTAGSEFLLTGDTPATVVIQSQTQHGSFDLEAKSVDGATLFIDQNGKTLRSYLYNFNEDAYNSTDISVLSSQLIDSPKDVAVLSGTQSEDANWVFIINQDGTGSILNTLRSQDINGFTKWIYGNNSTETPQILVSISVVNNDLYIVSKLEGTTSYYWIDRWSFDYLLDAGIKISDQSNTTVQLGTNHLDSLTVSVSARLTSDPTGAYYTLPQRAVAAGGGGVNGTITLTADELSAGNLDLQIGLNFVPRLIPMPLNTNSQAIAGQNQMREKKVTRMNLRVYESAGVYIDGNPVPIRQFGAAADSPLGTSFTPKTGIIQDNNCGHGWGLEVVPEITVPDPTSFHIQAIEYEVESS